MKDDYVYIVSSFHRSGSSMMMRCLEGGGIKTVFDPFLDTKWNTIFGSADYMPNPNGFYNRDDFDCDWASFYGDHKGKAIKVPRASLHLLREGKYKVIFMIREPKEILASMRKFAPFVSWGMMEVMIYLYDIIKKATLDRISSRKDIEVLEVNYADVVEDPLREFQKIKDFGFPIEVEKAAELVDKSLYRLRLEKK